MSTTTNVITGLKQLFHDKGANSTDVSDKIDDLTDLVVYVKVGGPGTAVNDYSIVSPPFNVKLESAHYVGEAVANTAGDDVVLTIATNGVTVLTYNSNTGASDALAANTVTDLSITNSNSFVDTGEQCILNWTMADAANNNINGLVRLVFSRQ